jgi:hypothetical protein
MAKSFNEKLIALLKTYPRFADDEENVAKVKV